MKYDIKNISIWKESPDRDTGNCHDGMRDISLEDMNLSVRSFNSLKRAGCSTVGDILDAMGEDGDGLRRIRNLGARSETEIKEKLEQLRLDYHARPTMERTYFAVKTGSTAGRVDNRFSKATEVIDMSGEEAEILGSRIILRPAKALWDREIGEFHLSHYAEDRLRRCGVRRLRDLYATHPKDEPGWYAVRELFRKIAEFG